jgi:hypothetical protein
MTATLYPGRSSLIISASFDRSGPRSRECSPGTRMGGIDRASMPRRKRTTFQADPPPETSKPAMRGSSAKVTTSRCWAAKMRARSMNWSSLAAGARPRMRTRT